MFHAIILGTQSNRDHWRCPKQVLVFINKANNIDQWFQSIRILSQSKGISIHMATSSGTFQGQ